MIACISNVGITVQVQILCLSARIVSKSLLSLLELLIRSLGVVPDGKVANKRKCANQGWVE